MQLADWQERDWKRAQRWADCCTRGECAYATERPERYLGGGCPGVHCTLHWEETQAVLRYRECFRKAAWWKSLRERPRTVQRVSRRLASDET